MKPLFRKRIVQSTHLNHEHDVLCLVTFFQQMSLGCHGMEQHQCNPYQPYPCWSSHGHVHGTPCPSLVPRGTAGWHRAALRFPHHPSPHSHPTEMCLGKELSERPLPQMQLRAVPLPRAAKSLAINQRIFPAQNSRCQTSACAFVSPSRPPPSCSLCLHSGVDPPLC